MRKTQKQRNLEQRERQKRIRHLAKAQRSPSRDDVARTLLHWIITRAAEAQKMNELDKLSDALIIRLVEQGFDERRCEDVIEALIEKYVSGRWSFQRKVHLSPPITS